MSCPLFADFASVSTYDKDKALFQLWHVYYYLLLNIGLPEKSINAISCTRPASSSHLQFSSNRHSNFFSQVASLSPQPTLNCA